MKLTNKQRFNNICKDIKEIKIQGATNVAKAALKSYYLFPSKKTKKKLLSLRPTEPMMYNILKIITKCDESYFLDHFEKTQEMINRQVSKLIKKNDVVFTHCHSSSVVKALIYTKKQGKKFEVYNTETRPLYQGRKTAKELSKAGIKVTNFVDSAIGIALDKEQGTKNVDLVLLGADAILKDGVINKVGSNTIAELAYYQKIPVYIIADSWKYSNKPVKLEQRKYEEVWKKHKNINIRNPAFEKIESKYIKGIISELGKFTLKGFISQVKKKYKLMFG